ncbi:MAG TPA: excinuclease ABC subunit UvrC [Candidatus Nanoarchaeia archaeon]|nr:excinuclease ABC subunit UvrC [Candidatus Nanoarchaeia archaeon]
MNLEKVKKLNIPTGPGSYQYYDRDGKIIYVGKAANLRARVLSYWRESSDLAPDKQQMLGEISEIKWVETDTEIEALLLEANLVKKYQPKYNIMLRDDKRYAYIKISLEDQWPRVFLTREITKQGKYFGPFLSAESVKEVLKIIRYIWPFRSCSTMPKRACLYYRLGKCPGMCQFPVSREEYLRTINEIDKFLQGKRKEVERDLKAEIQNLKKIIVGKSGRNTPRLARREPPLSRGEFSKEENKLNILNYRLFNLKKVLANSRILTVGEKYAADVIELAKTLNLPKVPRRIEGYDISNIFGKESVGSMVVFADGEPDKNEYRKFTIRGTADKTTPQPFLGKEGGDTGMLKEVLERRFYNDWPMPDLIIVDGGKGQLNACLSILKKFKLNIPIIAISKGEGLRSAHAPDKIFFPGMKTALLLPLASPSLHVIKRVRDEAHRFAIGFHRQRRSKNWLNK